MTDFIIVGARTVTAAAAAATATTTTLKTDYLHQTQCSLQIHSRYCY